MTWFHFVLELKTMSINHISEILCAVLIGGVCVLVALYPIREAQVLKVQSSIRPVPSGLLVDVFIFHAEGALSSLMACLCRPSRDLWPLAELVAVGNNKAQRVSVSSVDLYCFFIPFLINIQSKYKLMSPCFISKWAVRNVCERKETILIQHVQLFIWLNNYNKAFTHVVYSRKDIRLPSEIIADGLNI